MRLRFRAHVNIARASFSPEAVNSTSIGGFFVHRDFENVEQFQQVQPLEDASSRTNRQKRRKERGGTGREEDGGVKGKEGERKAKGKGDATKEDEKSGEENKGGKGGKMAKGKQKKDDFDDVMKNKEVGGNRKVNKEEEKETSFNRMGASGIELLGAENSIFTKVGDKKVKGKDDDAKQSRKSSKKSREVAEASNPIIGDIGKNRGKESMGQNPLAKSKKKDKVGGNLPLATTGDGKSNRAKEAPRPEKKDEGRRIFMRKKKAVESNAAAPKPVKLPPVDMNAPSARNPLLQYREVSGQLQAESRLRMADDAESGEEFDA